MERAYRAGVIGRAEMFKFKIMLIAHNAYKFQGRAQLYRNYLPQHIAIHVRKQYLAELNRKRKEEAALYYPQYQKIEVDSVTEVRDL